MGVVQKILGKAEFTDNKSEYFMIEFNKNNWIHIQNNSILAFAPIELAPTLAIFKF